MRELSFVTTSGAVPAEVKPKLVGIDWVRAEMALVEKKKDAALEAIVNNAARIGDDETAFGDPSSHMKELASFVQSVDDLAERCHDLAMIRDQANMVSIVPTDDGEVSTHTALLMKRRTLDWRKAARKALDTGWRHANSDRNMRSNPQTVVRMYDESKRLKELSHIEELDTRLGPVIKATNARRFIHIDGAQVTFYTRCLHDREDS